MLDVQKTDFDFEYTGSNFTEKEIIEQGRLQLSGKELQLRIVNKLIYGDYPIGYKFIAEIHENGIAKGINNVGSIDTGVWIIDFEKHTLQLQWKGAWVDTVTRAYNVNETIEFYDINTGKWRTTFKKCDDLHKSH